MSYHCPFTMYIVKHFIRIKDGKNHWVSSKEYDTVEELDAASLEYRKNHPGCTYMQRKVFIPDPEPAK